MANFVYIATSIDGFIARKDGSIDWLMELPNPEKSDYGYADFIKNIDAVVLGKNTFELVLSFGSWPYEKPVFVLSSSLKSVPENLADKIEIINAKPAEVVNKLNLMGFHSLYIDGGKTIQSFLEEDLIDDLIITRIPIILGDGIPLFSYLDKSQRYEQIQTEVYNNALVKTYYRRIKLKNK